MPEPSPEARCAPHGKAALSTCDRCGAFVCIDCGMQNGLCPACVERTAVAAEPRYFPISLPKLAALSLSTFGLYQLVWFYKCWRYEERSDTVSPVWRTIFASFSSFSLFARMKRSAASAGVPAAFSPNALGLLFLLGNMMARFGDRTDFLPMELLGMATSLVPLFIVQSAVNRLNAQVAPGADRNARFTLPNIAVMVLGGLFMMLLVIGEFLPDVE